MRSTLYTLSLVMSFSCGSQSAAIASSHTTAYIKAVENEYVGQVMLRADVEASDACGKYLLDELWFSSGSHVKSQ